MTMPYGVEYIVSEEPEDYDVQITKKVSEEEEQKLDNGKKELSDILSENTDLTFTNTKEVQPATGIRQTSAPYMVMTGVLYPFTHAGSDAGGPVWRDFWNDFCKESGYVPENRCRRSALILQAGTEIFRPGCRGIPKRGDIVYRAYCGERER